MVVSKSPFALRSRAAKSTQEMKEASCAMYGAPLQWDTWSPPAVVLQYEVSSFSFRYFLNWVHFPPSVAALPCLIGYSPRLFKVHGASSLSPRLATLVQGPVNPCQSALSPRSCLAKKEKKHLNIRTHEPGVTQRLVSIVSSIFLGKHGARPITRQPFSLCPLLSLPDDTLWSVLCR